jgi:hypothetical protein
LQSPLARVPLACMYGWLNCGIFPLVLRELHKVRKEGFLLRERYERIIIENGIYCVQHVCGVSNACRLDDTVRLWRHVLHSFFSATCTLTSQILNQKSRWNLITQSDSLRFIKNLIPLNPIIPTQSRLSNHAYPFRTQNLHTPSNRILLPLSRHRHASLRRHRGVSQRAEDRAANGHVGRSSCAEGEWKPVDTR